MRLVLHCLPHPFCDKNLNVAFIIVVVIMRKETFFRMNRNLITFHSRKRQKRIYFCTYWSKTSSSRWWRWPWANDFFSSLSLALLCKTPLFHESCPRLILWDTSFYSFFFWVSLWKHLQLIKEFNILNSERKENKKEKKTTKHRKSCC